MHPRVRVDSRDGRKFVDIALVAIGCVLLFVGAVELGATNLGMEVSSPLLGDGAVSVSVQTGTWFEARRVLIATGCVLVSGLPGSVSAGIWSPRHFAAGLALLAGWFPTQLFTLAGEYEAVRCEPDVPCAYVPFLLLLPLIGLPIIVAALALLLSAIARGGWRLWRAIGPAVAWLAAAYGQNAIWTPDVVERMWSAWM